MTLGLDHEQSVNISSCITDEVVNAAEQIILKNKIQQIKIPMSTQKGLKHGINSVNQFLISGDDRRSDMFKFVKQQLEPDAPKYDSVGRPTKFVKLEPYELNKDITSIFNTQEGKTRDLKKKTFHQNGHKRLQRESQTIYVTLRDIEKHSDETPSAFKDAEKPSRAMSTMNIETGDAVQTYDLPHSDTYSEPDERDQKISTLRR